MSDTFRMTIGTVLLGSALLIGPYTYSLAEERSEESGEWREHGAESEWEEHALAFSLFGGSKATAIPEEQAMYEEECSSCHIAYPAKFLPARSWHKIMSGLDGHFGENAELDTKTTEAISQYLQHASAQGRKHKVLRKLKDNETPIRITELPGYKRIHHKLPKDVLKRDPKLTSMSQCNVCHQKAKRGIFDEDDVDIPGFGRWDD